MVSNVCISKHRRLLMLKLRSVDEHVQNTVTDPHHTICRPPLVCKPQLENHYYIRAWTCSYMSMALSYCSTWAAYCATFSRHLFAALVHTHQHHILWLNAHLYDKPLPEKKTSVKFCILHISPITSSTPDCEGLDMPVFKVGLFQCHDSHR